MAALRPARDGNRLPTTTTDAFETLLAIQAQVNFKTGPAVISFVYKIVYDPTQTPDPWAVTSGLQTSISLF